MNIINSGISAIGKLISVVVLLAAFLGGMAGVVYMSLYGEEIKVPEITGKDFVESEKELAGLGLKVYFAIFNKIEQFSVDIVSDETVLNKLGHFHNANGFSFIPVI